jgi:tRNA(His) guanylyltransferase
MSDDIGDRFKAYERVFDYSLPRRMPMVIRVDGRAFHGIKLEKPFDLRFFTCMAETAGALCKEIQGAVLAYFQSDEISIVARDDMQNTTQPWVGKRLSKVLSLSAGTASTHFNAHFGGMHQFDSRAFVLPDLSEVVNYLIWRQQDATRNSVSMAAHAEFSHKSLHGVDSNGMIDRLREAGKPWEDVPTVFRRGAIIRPVKINKLVPRTGETCERREWQLDAEIPIFTQDRAYIDVLYGMFCAVESTASSPRTGAYTRRSEEIEG